MLSWSRPVSFVNARVLTPDGIADAMRFTHDVLALDGPPRSGDLVVDLDGAFVLPGLINAHDHLELNHYGRLRPRQRYVNATEWIDDLRPLLPDDPAIRRNSAYPLAARLFVGGLKNLLAGATTVAHHNPRYREIGRSFPVRVLKRYGWAHSFSLEGQPVGAGGEPGGDVRQRCAATPSNAPFMVHLGEGTDAAASQEFERLDSLGCVRDNTVIVHGVALAPRDWSVMMERGASLVWCPASNAFLFGSTAPVRRFLDASERAPAHLCLGSDSRVTGARDLLDELRSAAAAAPFSPAELLRMVTDAAARVLHLPGAGRIAVGSRADLIVVPPLKHDAASTLLAASRRDLSLVAIGGRPLLASSLFRAVFTARRAKCASLVVDGAERLADDRLAAAIARCPIVEPGVQVRN